jgi:ABC-type Fe3+/spermidine/putrescine transport system ATPase subunit
MLELVGLEQHADRRVTELSGGQQQRVALARALVNEPEVLLLDEPLAVLDLQLRKRLQEQLREIHQRLATTFIYVTHDQEEALKLSHRVALMRDGRLVQLGTPRHIYERPASRFAAEFIGESNLLEGVVEAVSARQVHVRLPGGDAQTPLEWTGGARPTVGDRVVASIRPEHVTQAHGAPAQLTGAVRDAVYLGSALRHSVALPDGQRVLALTSTDSQWAGEAAALRVTRGVALALDE